MKTEKLYPKYTTESKGFFNAIETIDNPFLQGIVDAKAMLVLMQGEFTVLACESLALLFVYEDHVEIECISTPVEERGKGSATKVMQGLCEIADNTKTVLTLRTANVSGNGWDIPQHLVVNHGMVKKGKIPTAKLPDWYSKFGFEKVEKVLRKGRSTGWRMIRNPKTVTNE